MVLGFYGFKVLGFKDFKVLCFYGFNVLSVRSLSEGFWLESLGPALGNPGFPDFIEAPQTLSFLIKTLCYYSIFDAWLPKSSSDYFLRFSLWDVFGKGFGFEV